MKKIIVVLCICLLSLTGCSDKKTEQTKIKDLEFTVLNEDAIPDELKTEIEARKNAEFKLTFSDGQYLYIAAGYGEQISGGYSVQVNELYLTDNAIYFDSNLIGPNKDENIKKAPSYPLIIVKLEFIDKSVVFN